MKTSYLVRVTILLLIASSLSGCLWVADDGYYDRGGGGGGHHRGDRGEHRGDHHDRD